MTILDRYLFRSILTAVLAGVTLFIFVLLTGNMLRDVGGWLASGQLTGPIFLRMLLLLIPFCASFALPFGLLVGLLLVLGRMQAGREIVAMKGAGWSLWRISLGPMIVALLGSVFCALVHHEYAPRAREQYKSLFAETIGQDPLRFVTPRTFVREFSGYIIYVGNRRDNLLENFWLWELDPDNRPTRLVRARQGSFRFDRPGESLILTLRDGFGEFRDPERPGDLAAARPILTFSETSLRLPISPLFGQRSRPRDPARSATSEMIPILARLRQGGPVPEDPYAGDTPELRQKEIRRLEYQIQRRSSMAVSAVALALVGIPLGVMTGRKETHANLGLALLLGMLFYLVLILVDWQAGRPELHPELLVWLPNVIFGGLGLAMLTRANRH